MKDGPLGVVVLDAVLRQHIRSFRFTPYPLLKILNVETYLLVSSAFCRKYIYFSFVQNRYLRMLHSFLDISEKLKKCENFDFLEDSKLGNLD